MKQKAQQAEFNHKKELMRATLIAEERSRERLAKNIHDHLGTYVSIVSMGITRLKNLLKDNEEELLEIIDEQKKHLKHISNTARNVTRDLASPALIKFGFIGGINDLITALNQNNDVSIDFDYTHEGFRFAQDSEIQLFRIVNELINNLLKHAKPTSIHIQFDNKESIITLIISHDGDGLSMNDFEEKLKTSNGSGLKSIKNRVDSINGTIYFYSKSGEESIIEISLTQ